jgi:hypothetical protein
MVSRERRVDSSLEAVRASHAHFNLVEMVKGGTTISGANGSEATTAQGAIVPSSGPAATPRAM